MFLEIIKPNFLEILAKVNIIIIVKNNKTLRGLLIQGFLQRSQLCWDKKSNGITTKLRSSYNS